MILNILTKPLNDDLKKILDWTYQWKMSLSPDLYKQAQEVMFSQETSSLPSFSYFQQLPCCTNSLPETTYMKN